VYKWYKDFSDGRETVEDEPRSGRPSTSTNEEYNTKINDLILSNHRLNIRDIVDITGILFGSIQSILKNN